MSALLEHPPQLDAGSHLLNHHGRAARPKRGARWLNFVAASVMPVAVALVIMWVAAVGIVVLRDFVSMKFPAHII
jgi:hypothetical protein